MLLDLENFSSNMFVCERSRRRQNFYLLKVRLSAQNYFLAVQWTPGIELCAASTVTTRSKCLLAFTGDSASSFCDCQKAPHINMRHLMALEETHW